MYATAVGELLVCPLCGEPFLLDNSMLRCSNAHSFDLAKEGYVNLLRKKVLGDTKEMVLARRAFFDKGYYQPVSDLLNQLLVEHLSLPPKQPLGILDAGCGEGYYGGRFHEYLQAQGESVVSLGIDSSRDAVRMAAKRYPASFFLVADLKSTLPLRDGTLDVMLNIFAPRNLAEYARLLAPAGLLLILIPGPTHILQLRQTLHLLDIEENKEQHVLEQSAMYFELLTKRSLTYDLALQREEITQLVMMTPNYWHLSDEIRARMLALETLSTTIDFICLLFKVKQST
jgi:SAM-dependent methyltransferase